MKRSIIATERLRDRQSSQVLQLSVIEYLPVQRPRGCSQLAKSGGPPGFDVLTNRMVMIAANRRDTVFLHPLDTGNRIRSVIDEVSEEQANVPIFLDSRQGVPVGM